MDLDKQFLLLLLGAAHRVGNEETSSKYAEGIREKSIRAEGSNSESIFDKQQVIDALGTGTTKVSVVGQMDSGRCFFGNETIRIIDRHWWPWWKW